MARPDFILNQLALAFAENALYASLHDGDPGVTGANEVTGTVRMPINWIPLGGGRIDSQPIGFLIPAANLTHVGFWTHQNGGTFVDSAIHVVEIQAEGTFRFVLSYTQV